MVYSDGKGKNNLPKKQTVGIIFLIIVGTLAGAFLVISATWCNHDTVSKVLTHGYINVTVQEAYMLYNTDDNLLIVDARGCPCTYENVGHIPGAIHIKKINYTSYEKIYNPNKNKDILIYDGEYLSGIAEWFYNTTYGKIYCLIGGFNAWESNGFPIVKGSNPS